MLGNLIYGFLYILFKTLRAIGWWRWRVEGWENLPPRQQGGVVIAMNHLNWIDIPVVGALLPFAYRLSWLAKSELFQHPLAAWFFRTMYVIPIQRGKRDLAALETATQALRDGAVLLIFPEGTRSRSGGLGTGRGGAIRMAMQAGVPIVPIAVTGTEHGLKGTLTRKPVLMRIGQPFLVAPTPDGKIPPDMMDQLTNDMMLRIARMLPDSYQGAYRAALAQGQDDKMTR
ncbi:MAG: 1-acyl-sn-glycerol-3-phosphate acyltransferase [Chloroflexaceae bacterium]|jgi:1-acyl-sn-glycerol-3-phosphate acyltransferase|nr:1-acyl-sn-glycerol-3-phosphate acyltransferase [Chloroflexaceae bacterium]